MTKRFKFFDKNLMSIKTDKGKLSIFALALPIFFEAVASIFMGLIQSVMASRYQGGFLIIPMNIANSVMSFFESFNFITTFGISILLSAYIGKGDKEAQKRAIGNAIILNVVFSMVLSLVGIFTAEQTLSLMGINDPEYLVYKPYAIKHLRLRIIAVNIFKFYTILTMALRCYGYSGIGFIISIANNSVNAILTAIFLFAIKIELESAIFFMNLSVLISIFCGMIMAVVFFFNKGLKLSLKPKLFFLKKLLKVGFPSSVTNVSFCLSQIITTAICISLSPVDYEAKIFITQIINFSYQLGGALGSSNGILVGRLCGKGDFELADKITYQSLRTVIVVNLTISVTVALFGGLLIKGLFDASDEVIKVARLIFWVDVLVELGRAPGHVGEGVMRSTGQVLFMAIVSTLSCWIIGVGGAFVLGIVLGLGLMGMWIALAIDENVRGICFITKYKKGDWKKSFVKKIF